MTDKPSEVPGPTNPETPIPHGERAALNQQRLGAPLYHESRLVDPASIATQSVGAWEAGHLGHRIEFVRVPEARPDPDTVVRRCRNCATFHISEEPPPQGTSSPGPQSYRVPGPSERLEALIAAEVFSDPPEPTHYTGISPGRVRGSYAGAAVMEAGGGNVSHVIGCDGEIKTHPSLGYLARLWAALLDRPLPLGDPQWVETPGVATYVVVYTGDIETIEDRVGAAIRETSPAGIATHVLWVAA